MNVLYICGFVNRIGGIEKYNKDFIESLQKTDVNLCTVQRYPGGLLAKVSFLIRVVFAYLVHRPHLVICGHLHFAVICTVFKKILGIKYYLSLYGIEIISLKTKTERESVELAEKVITISEYSRQLILEKFPDIDHKLFMHPSSVDGAVYKMLDPSRELIEKFKLQDKFVLLSLARLSTGEHKGQDRVLKALPEVLKVIPNLRYLIVGSGVDERVDHILQQQPELNDVVVKVGPVKDLEKPEYYNLADAYILPSKFEGFGIVFIESLSCGVPVIASDGYGCRVSLLNGEIGHLVDPDNTLAIAHMIIKVLRDQEKQKNEVRQKLRDKTLSIYGIDAWNMRVKKLITELKA